jgi:hypothetical protein
MAALLHASGHDLHSKQLSLLYNKTPAAKLGFEAFIKTIAE